MAQRAAVLTDFPTLHELAAADPATLRRAFDAVNDDLFAASEREALAGARIIVWPETGAGTLAEDAPALAARAATFTRHHGVYLVMGVGVLTRTEPYLRNQSVLVDPARAGRLDLRQGPPHPRHGGAHTRRRTGTDRRQPHGRLATVICFDLDFPGLARQGGRAGVDLMLVPSNDWPEFGKVHTEKATIRAVENGYSVVARLQRAGPGGGLPRSSPRLLRLLHHRPAGHRRLHAD